MGTRGQTSTFRLDGSGEVVRLLYIDAILAEGWSQVLHGKSVLAVLREEGRAPAEHRYPIFHSQIGGDPK